MELILFIVWLVQDKKEISLLWILTSKEIIIVRLFHYFLFQEPINEK